MLKGDLKKIGMDVREVPFCFVIENNFFLHSTTPTFPLRRRPLRGSMIAHITQLHAASRPVNQISKESYLGVALRDIGRSSHSRSRGNMSDYSLLRFLVSTSTSFHPYWLYVSYSPQIPFWHFYY